MNQADRLNYLTNNTVRIEPFMGTVHDVLYVRNAIFRLFISATVYLNFRPVDLTLPLLIYRKNDTTNAGLWMSLFQ
jgi:hypothetical protein